MISMKRVIYSLLNKAIAIVNNDGKGLGVSFNGCIFEGCQTAGSGGAISLISTASIQTVHVNNSYFTNCTAGKSEQITFVSPWQFCVQLFGNVFY